VLEDEAELDELETLLDPPDEPRLIVTLPVASNLWSAGVKKEITPEFLSGVLIETVRDRESDPWFEDEVLCAEACCAAAAWAAAWDFALAAALAAALVAASAAALAAASACCLAAASAARAAARADA